MTQPTEKHRELNILTFIAFTDYTMAFDRVIQNKLWEIMEEKAFQSIL
jgi:hypothetical protein